MKLKKQQNRGRKHAKILAAMLVFLLCGCNHRDTEYKLSDSTGGSTAETVSENQKEMDEEQTVSGKSAGETTGIPEKREAQEAAPEETVQIYICGAVVSPGVYTLPGGSRVVQAVEAAGGFLPDAEEKILNLARKIEDGEQITVWTREEAENMENTELLPLDAEQGHEETEYSSFDLCLGESFVSPLVEQHRQWLKSIRHETPSPKIPFKVAVYIRFFNQTKYGDEEYLERNKEVFRATLAQYPLWKFVGFYIDNGSTAPYMEKSSAWTELLSDCDEGKVNLIITQKVSNVSRDVQEVTICARMLAARNPPVGIYFISEDLYTLASYYRDDLREPCFFPTPDWSILPDDELDVRGALHG